MLEYLERVLSSDDIDQIWSCHCETMRHYGFDRLLYGFVPFRTQLRKFDESDALILNSHGPLYVDRLGEPDIFVANPILHWLESHEGPLLWSQLNEWASAGLLSQSGRRVLEVKHQLGATAGLTISFGGLSKRALAWISLCAMPGLSQADVDRIWDRNRQELTVLNAATHLKITSLPFPSSVTQLTARQREVLEWVADGKTIADIAELMGLTTATVEKHLRLARETMRVDTTVQATVKALLQKRLFYPVAPVRAGTPSRQPPRG